MNLLLLKEPLPADGRVLVSGERAQHIACVLRAKPGDRIRAGILNGEIGTVLLEKVSRGEVAVRDFIVSGTPPPEPLPLALAVALPRPQSFKKVLHFAVSSGIRKILFFQSARVEKSYWNSEVLDPENLAEEIALGLEQGVDTRAPELKFFRTFHEFLEYGGTAFPEHVKILAHPSPLRKFDLKGKQILLAVGPEGGFLPSETEAFAKNGFIQAGFGAHILRVEFAAAFISGWLAGAGL